ncbi:hypothetical protein EIK77_006327 [Talaromyces pinophilus]|nr:hypothetical protein EIK77_006327 [Talaromyces pinophilus]
MAETKVIGNSKKSILERLPGRLPTASIPEVGDWDSISKEVLENLPNLSTSLLADDAIWRDSYALTGTFRTFYFPGTIAREWAVLCKQRGILSAKLIPGSSRVVRIGSKYAWLDCKFSFTTANPTTECSGFLSLVPSEGSKWKIWILRTILEQITGHGDVDSLAPCLQNGSATGSKNGPTNGSSKYDTYVAIIGGGQAGLSTGGRLQALGVPYVILEKNSSVGDAWKNRYTSARRKLKSCITCRKKYISDLFVIVHTVREYC